MVFLSPYEARLTSFFAQNENGNSMKKILLCIFFLGIFSFLGINISHAQNKMSTFPTSLAGVKLGDLADYVLEDFLEKGYYVYIWGEDGPPNKIAMYISEDDDGTISFGIPCSPFTVLGLEFNHIQVFFSDDIVFKVQVFNSKQQRDAEGLTNAKMSGQILKQMFDVYDVSKLYVDDKNQIAGYRDFTFTDSDGVKFGPIYTPKGFLYLVLWKP